MNKKLDPSFNRLMQFAKNHRPFGGFSNMYLLQTKNEKGEVTNEAYGMNLMTDLGMKEWFTKTNTTFPKNLYVGAGGRINFSYDSNVLIDPYEDVGAATIVSDVVDYAYPMYYSSDLTTEEGGIITCMMKYLQCSYAPSVAHNEAAFPVGEYGIGTDINNLWTHSWVYAQDGSATIIEKKLNETLEITVYLCYSYYESLIKTAWDRGVYLMITTMHMFMNRMREEKAYTYKRNAQLHDKTSSTYSTTTISLFENNKITNTRQMKSFSIYQGGDANAGYMDGFYFNRTGFSAVDPVMLDHDENITINNLFSKDPMSYEGFSDKFGNSSYDLYFTQIDMKKVCMFNHKQLADTSREAHWNNTIEFHNNAEHWYDESTLSSTFAQPIYYSNNDEIVKVFVYQNIRTDDPIIKLKGNISTLYATNAYWDRHQWEQIYDFEKIPEKLQTCKYWITTSDSISITPVRKSDSFYLKPIGRTNHGYINYVDFGEFYANGPGADNYEYGWYMHGNKIHYVGDSNIKTRKTIGNDNGCATFTYGKHIVVCDNSTSFWLMDASTFSGVDGIVATQTAPLFTTSTNMLTKCYRTESTTGIICLQSLSNSEANIINLIGNSFSQKLISAKMSTAIWGKHQVAYIPADDMTKLRIFDFDTNTDVNEITLPDGINGSTITMMYGHTNYVWFTNGSTYAYVYDNISGSIEGAAVGSFNKFANTQQNIRITAVDDVFIMYRTDLYRFKDDSANMAVCCRIDNPSEPFKMTELIPPDDNNVSACYFTLRYTNEHTLLDNSPAKTLVLLATRGYLSNSNAYKQGSENMVYDFGQYLFDKTTNIALLRWNRHIDNNMSNYIFYGDNIVYRTNRLIPICDFMPVKLEGTSRTVGTQNKTKNISDELFQITFSNQPLFGTDTDNGIPPGVLN